MAAITRKSYQGVLNIIRFNWHFYVISIIIFSGLIFLSNYLPYQLQLCLLVGAGLAIFTILISLVVSYYVYDISNLYQLPWLDKYTKKNGETWLNINAGFDETSGIIQEKFPEIDLSICDFYDSEKHTEVSIKRARKAYPPIRNTISVNTENLPFERNTFEYVLAVLSAHEIRDEKERIVFFKELNRVTKGKIFVTEHLRDVNNFLAYSIGFLHFHSHSSWKKTFEQAGLIVEEEMKTTPFITTFILKNNGDTL